MLYVGENKQRKKYQSSQMQKKKNPLSCILLKDFILRGSIQDSPLFSPAIFVLKLPLKSSESLGLSKT